MSERQNKLPMISLQSPDLLDNSDDSFEKQLEKMKAELEELESDLSSKALSHVASVKSLASKGLNLDDSEDSKYKKEETKKQRGKPIKKQETKSATASSIRYNL